MKFTHPHIPKESDTKGTAYRIRPQTPKLNLLNKQKKPQAVGRLEPLQRKPINLEPIKKKPQEFVIDNLGDERDDLTD